MYGAGIEKVTGQEEIIDAPVHVPETPGLARTIDIVTHLPAISLSQISSAKLMDRIDTKYVLHISVLPVILERVADQYQVLDINGIKAASYHTVYYDDPDFVFYRNHVNGKLNRSKVRKRGYIESDLFYLEVKGKTNKGKTLKKRVMITDPEDSFTDDAVSLIKQYAGTNHLLLNPVLINDFTRITLVNYELTERVTIDFNLRFRKPDDRKSLILPGLVIVESKQEKSGHSVIREVLFSERIAKTGISKYCLGIALTHTEQKLNRMKFKIRKINKLLNHEYAVNCH